MNFGNPKTGDKRKNDESNDGRRKRASAGILHQHENVHEQIQHDLKEVDEANTMSRRLEVNIQAMDIYQKAIEQCEKVYFELDRLETETVVHLHDSFFYANDDYKMTQEDLKECLRELPVSAGAASDEWVCETFDAKKWFDITKTLNIPTYSESGTDLRSYMPCLIKSVVPEDPTRFMAAELKTKAKHRQSGLQKQLQNRINYPHRVGYRIYGAYKNFCEMKGKFEQLKFQLLSTLKENPEYEDDVRRIIQRIQSIWRGGPEGHGPQRLHAKTMDMFDACNQMMEVMGTTLPFRLGKPMDHLLEEVKEEDCS